jgi:hypothetical protein
MSAERFILKYQRQTVLHLIQYLIVQIVTGQINIISGG